MTTAQIIGIAIVIIVIVVIATWFGTRRTRTRYLRNHFGPEYDRRLVELGSRKKAEASLSQSEARLGSARARPLNDSDRARFRETWRQCQARFVDDPADAVMDADRLLTDIMHTRGYNMEDPINRSSDICAAYPNQAGAFREANDIVIRHRRGEASTEDLRKAFINYRGLFEETLGGQNEKLYRVS